MKHIVDNVNKLELTFKTIDLEGRVPATDSIEFLSVEEPYQEGRRYSPFVRVRYSLNGIKQDKAFPLDVDKGIFLSIDDAVLEERLRPIAPKIVEILQEHALKQNVERKDSIRMTLKEHIDDIRNQLKQGAFGSETAVSFGIVLRLLEPLGWPKFTPQVIIPEYTMEGQRVDFALCHPPGKPLVFIEVKQVGNLEGVEEQLFRHAVRKGVPIVILTDGQKWRFFYPIGQGDFRERKVHEFDLIESDSEESAERLNRYLNYGAVQTGNAVTAIKNDYQNVSKQREIEARLPEFWNELLEKKNEYLLLPVMEIAKEKVGHEPTEEQVLTFLKSLKVVPKPPPISPEYKGLIVIMPNGEVINHKRASNTFVEVIEKLGIERVKALNKEYIIPLISDSKHPLYNQGKSGNYYIMTNSDTKTKKRLLDEIALDIGVRLDVKIVEKE